MDYQPTYDISPLSQFQRLPYFQDFMVCNFEVTNQKVKTKAKGKEKERKLKR